jgi:hypothetical protein
MNDIHEMVTLMAYIGSMVVTLSWQSQPLKIVGAKEKDNKPRY